MPQDEVHSDDEQENKTKLKKKQQSFMSNPVAGVIEPVREFVVEGVRLYKKCTKPDAAEFKKIAYATSVGFLIMGFVGFFVKIIHIPINNILVGNMM